MLAFLLSDGEIGVSAEVAVDIFARELDAGVVSLFVVEGGEHIGGAELAVIQQIACCFVIGVDTEFETGQHLLRHAHIVDVGTFGLNLTVGARRCGLLGRARCERRVGRRGQHLWRRA